MSLRLKIVLTLFVISSLMSCVTMVRSDERAVVRRFGKVLPEKPRPGLLIGLPWGFDQVDRVSMKDRTVTVGWTDREADDDGMTPGLLLTGDHNLLNVQAVIEYRVIEDDAHLVQYVLLQSRVEPLIARATEAALAEWLAGQEVDDAILNGKKRLGLFLRERVEKSIAAYDLGVQIDRASIMLIQPPSKVREFFDAVGEAHTAMQTQITKAEEDKKSSEFKAKAEVVRIKNDSAAYAREQELAAQADADNFLVRLAEYRRLRQDNPQYLNQLWLDEVTRIYAQLRRSGRLDLLDHHVGMDGLNITQFPLQKKR